MADRILVVDDEQIIRESLSFVLKKEGYAVTEAANGKIALEQFMHDSFDVVISDLEMPELRGIDLLERIHHLNPQVPFLIITAYGSLETAIAALRKGASDYILKPLEFDDLLLKIRHTLDHRRLLMENQLLRRELQRQYDFTNFVGKSASMQRVFEMIKTVASTATTVLITGKSGTGKELTARAVHAHSDRSQKPFVAVNCGAIPDTLIESELFGHKKGSFTGAHIDRVGYFKAADGGTLFLDEISEMPLPLQVKLLRAIEQKEITPVGMSTPITVDVRILASTNRDLPAEVDAGRFRKDLFYRLNVVEIHLPSLSERSDDIPMLVDHFISKYRVRLRKNITGASQTLMQALMNHTWQGEIRELENVIERGVIFCKGDHLTVADLPESFSSAAAFQVPQEHTSLEDAMKSLERQYISSVLQNHNFDKNLAAQILKISLPTLYRRIKDLDIADKE
jgi:two-component system response regulator PilR (NtrC family)